MGCQALADDIQFSLVNLSGRIPHLSSSLRGHLRGCIRPRTMVARLRRTRFVPKCVNLTAFRPCLLAAVR